MCSSSRRWNARPFLKTQKARSCFIPSVRTASATLVFTMSRPVSSSLVCGLLGCVFAASTLLWLKLDRAPPNWDDAWYLTNSLTVYDALTQGGVIGYLTKLNSVFGFKAPLIAALPAGFYLLLGRHWHAAYLGQHRIHVGALRCALPDRETLVERA